MKSIDTGLATITAVRRLQPKHRPVWPQKVHDALA
jgi:hypothetical protein